MYKLARILYELLEEWRRALEGNGLLISKSITETIVNDFKGSYRKVDAGKVCDKDGRLYR